MMPSLENYNKWALDSYAVWKGNTWEEKNIDKQTSYIMLIYSQVLVLSKEKLHESLNLFGGQYALFFGNATIGINIIGKNKNRRFRVHFAEGYRLKSSMENCLEVVTELEKFIPVTQHPCHSGKEFIKSSKIKTPELARKLFQEKKVNFEKVVESFMKEETSEHSMRLFFFDPRKGAIVNKIPPFPDIKKLTLLN